MVEHVIQAAQTAPRRPHRGPNSIELDLLTRPLLRTRALLRADVAKNSEAGSAERASDQTFAYLDALRTVIQKLVEGNVRSLAMSMFSATGFAFAKPDGGIKPVACGIALRRLAFPTISAGEHGLPSTLQTALGATQFGVSYPGAAATSGPATQIACATGTQSERAHCVSVRCCANVCAA